MIVVVGALLVAVIYFYYRNAFAYWERRGVPTLPPSFPFGNMFRVVFRMESVNDKVCEIYDKMKRAGHAYAGIYFFSRKVFLAIDPHLIKCMLGKDFRYFNDRGIYYDEQNDPVSAHLFSLSGPKWKNLRSKLTPAFTAGKTKYMFDAIKSCGDDMVQLLEKLIEQDENVEIKDVLARFTTDVIGSCAFGIECNSLANPSAEFREMGRRAFTQTPGDVFKMVIIRSFPQLAKLLRLGVFAPKVSKFFQQVVEDTVDYRERHNLTRPDFLQLLIRMRSNKEDPGVPLNNCPGGGKEEPTENDAETAVGLTMNEIAAQAFIFFLAGFETTSTTISFALLEMALNPGIQERARAELATALSKHENKLTYDAVGELKFLETIVLESLRKYPPAPVFLRKCTERYQVPGTNVYVEKGVSALIPAMALHRDPDFYPNPDRFDPDRFNDPNRHKIKEHVYLPFGDGPRICIGMRFAMFQAKFALAQFLQHYRFALSEKMQMPLIMETKGIVLTPIGGMWMKFSKATLATKI